MSDYKQVFKGYMNYNTKGLEQNPKAPMFKSGGPKAKSKIVVEEDIPKGSVIVLAAWGGKGEYGKYLQINAQIEAKTAPQFDEQPDFDDDLPF